MQQKFARLLIIRSLNKMMSYEKGFVCILCMILSPVNLSFCCLSIKVLKGSCDDLFLFLVFHRLD